MTVNTLGWQARACVWQGLWKERISRALFLKTQGGGALRNSLGSAQVVLLQSGPRPSQCLWVPLGIDILEPFVSPQFLKI